jgi:hypothetical protein
MKYIYVISMGPRCVKVGIAADPKKRLASLQVGCPYLLKVFRVFEIQSVRSAYHFEMLVHRELRPWALWGEWFAVTPERAAATVAAVLGLEVGSELTGGIRLICQHCSHFSHSKLDQATISASKFRCTGCDRVVSGKRFLIRAVA